MPSKLLFEACKASPTLYSNSTFDVFFVVGSSSAKAFEDVVAFASASEDIFTTFVIASTVVVTTFYSESEDVALTSAVFFCFGRNLIVVCVMV